MSETTLRTVAVLDAGTSTEAGVAASEVGASVPPSIRLATSPRGSDPSGVSTRIWMPSLPALTNGSVPGRAWAASAEPGSGPSSSTASSVQSVHVPSVRVRTSTRPICADGSSQVTPSTSNRPGRLLPGEHRELVGVGRLDARRLGLRHREGVQRGPVDPGHVDLGRGHRRFADHCVGGHLERRCGRGGAGPPERQRQASRRHRGEGPGVAHQSLRLVSASAGSQDHGSR